jgi:hypothetical protein
MAGLVRQAGGASSPSPHTLARKIDRSSIRSSSILVSLARSDGLVSWRRWRCADRGCELGGLVHAPALTICAVLYTGGHRDRRDEPRRDDRDRRDRRDEPRRDDRPRERETRRRSRSRSVSESPPPGPRKNRKTKFDILPAGMTPEQAAVIRLTGHAPVADPIAAAVMGAGGLPMPPPLVPGMLPLAGELAVRAPPCGAGNQGQMGPLPHRRCFSFAPRLAGMNMLGSQNTPASQQATRHARRVYVGGLPPTGNEQSIATFFSHALAAIGGNSAGPGEQAVVRGWEGNAWPLPHGALLHACVHASVPGDPRSPFFDCACR